MKEGTGCDARRIKSQAEAFLKEEVFKISSLFGSDDELARIAEVAVVLDDDGSDELADRLFRQRQTPKLLVIGSCALGQQLPDMVADNIEWHVAGDTDRAMDVLTKEEIDFVLLDLDMERDVLDVIWRDKGCLSSCAQECPNCRFLFFRSRTLRPTTMATKMWTMKR